jgi:hypothetical protein
MQLVTGSLRKEMKKNPFEANGRTQCLPEGMNVV